MLGVREQSRKTTRKDATPGRLVSMTSRSHRHDHGPASSRTVVCGPGAARRGGVLAASAPSPRFAGFRHRPRRTSSPHLGGRSGWRLRSWHGRHRAVRHGVLLRVQRRVRRGAEMEAPRARRLPRGDPARLALRVRRDRRRLVRGVRSVPQRGQVRGRGGCLPRHVAGGLPRDEALPRARELYACRRRMPARRR